MTPDKIKNMIWDKFTSSVSFYILFVVLHVCICTVYFYLMSANLSFYCPFLLIFILVCFCVFYVSSLSCFVCCYMA